MLFPSEAVFDGEQILLMAQIATEKGRIAKEGLSLCTTDEFMNKLLNCFPGSDFDSIHWGELGVFFIRQGFFPFLPSLSSM